MLIRSWLALALVAACSDDPDNGETKGPDPCKKGGAIELSDDQNYNYQGDMDVPAITTASGTDIEICWDGLTTDLQCHDLDPSADIDNVGLVRFTELTHDEVELGLAQDNLLQSNVSGYVEYPPGTATCAQLADFSFFGTPIDLAVEYTEAGGTYMLIHTQGNIPGVGSRMVTFLQPEESSDVTSIDIGEGCGILDFSVDLQSLDAKAVCASADSYEIDWSGVTSDGLGNLINVDGIDRLLVGRYEDMTRADLEAQFFDLEQLATESWELAHEGGTSADLSLATNDAGAFSGFDGDGIWVFAAMCTTCSNPAPLFLTFLEPS